jgi:hypothetical protein
MLTLTHARGIRLKKYWTHARGLRLSTYAQGLRLLTYAQGLRLSTYAQGLRLSTYARGLRLENIRPTLGGFALKIFDPRSGASPLDLRSGASPLDLRSGASSFDLRSGALPFDLRSGASPFDLCSGARVQKIHSAYDQRRVIRVHRVCTTYIYNRQPTSTKLLEDSGAALSLSLSSIICVAIQSAARPQVV